MEKNQKSASSKYNLCVLCVILGEDGLWGNEEYLPSKKSFDYVQICSVFPQSSR